MGEGAFTKEGLTQYLLGSLPEPEVERFDELSVTDDEFADALSGAENDLVDAYVQGELSTDDLEQFKSHYLASPRRLEKVKFAQAFQGFAEREGVAALPATEARTKVELSTKTKRAGWLSGLLVPQPALHWGLAAAFLTLLVAGSWLAFENIRLRQRVSETQANRDLFLKREQELQKEIEAQRSTNLTMEQELARIRDERERLDQELKSGRSGVQPAATGASIVSMILAPPLRGVSRVPTINIKPRTSQVSAQLELEATGYSAYRVALFDPVTNQTLWRSGILRPTTKGGRQSIYAGFSTELLKPRNYILQVTGISGSSSEAVGDYPFKVLKYAEGVR